VLQTALLAMLVATGPATSKPTTSKPKLMVLELTPAGGVEKEVAGALTEAITGEISSRGFFDVLSAKDVNVLIGVERQKQLMGCAEGSSCLAELAGAIGAKFVLSGSVAKLGDVFQLTLQMLDSERAQPVGRSTRLAKDLSVLRQQLPYSVAEATATPIPAGPSRIIPYSLIGLGSLSLAGGFMLGISAFTREGVVLRELESAKTGGLLRTAQEYRVERDEIIRMKNASALGLGLGAALVGLGIFLNPPDVAASGARASLRLVPSPNGVALVGVLP